MRRLKDYVIQRSASERLLFHDVPRVSYDELFKTLRFPLIWARDELLGAWLPTEADEATIVRIKAMDQSAIGEAQLRLLQRLNLPVAERPLRDELRQQLSAQGYVVLPKLLDATNARTFWTDYYFRSPDLHERWPDMEGIKRTSRNNTPLLRLLHQATESLVRDVTGEDLKTSYSFTSAYESGSRLPRHTDRPQCVWNISLLLGSQPIRSLKSWPLYIERDGATQPIALEPGDAVLYSGIRDPHWRDAMPSDLSMVLGAFLHYVRSDWTGSLD